MPAKFVAASRLILAAVFAAVVLTPASALAAPNGISLSPFLQPIQILPGDGARSFTVTVGNNTKAVQEIILSARDFGTLDETGGLILEGARGGYSQKYGLASWLTLGQDTVVLQPGESKAVEATIENRSSLRPGGHYGAVVATIGRLDAQTTDKVIINQQLMALVLVTKVGGEKYDLRLKEISHDGNWVRLPKTVKLRFQNPGNVHVIPRGVVELKSPAGTVVAKGIVNSESSFVLPETFREIPVELRPVSSAFPWPGQYRLSVQYRYEGVAGYATKTIGLKFINLGMYALLAVLIIAGSWIVKRRLAKRTKKPAKTAKESAE